jgi:hypothetical protein
MNERGLGDPLVDRSGSAGPGEDAEAGAGVAVAPRGSLNLEPAETSQDRANVDPSITEVLEVAAGGTHGGRVIPDWRERCARS